MLESVCLLDDGKTWSLGSLMICERVPLDSIAEDAVASWTDGGVTYQLRKRASPLESTKLVGDPKAGRMGDYNIRSSAWTLSPDVFCKSTSWVPGMELEGDNISFAKAHLPSIPAPEVLHNWCDPEWSRSFLITRRVPGRSVSDSWPFLSLAQQASVTQQVADMIRSIAQLRSTRCENVFGGGMRWTWRLVFFEDPGDWPGWKPIQHEPFGPEKIVADTELMTKEPCPDIGNEVVLWNPNLQPSHVFLSVPTSEEDDVHVTTVLDWEDLLYVPSWFINSQPWTTCLFLLDSWDEEKGQTDFDYIKQVCERSEKDFPRAEPLWLLKIMSGRSKLWRSLQEGEKGKEEEVIG